MTIFTGIIVFLMIFWTALFVVLPWGNAPSQKVEAGHFTSAPDKPRLLKKFITTFFLSLILWLIIAYLIEIDMIDFHAISNEMFLEDRQN
jgi:predicted secreted protein